MRELTAALLLLLAAQAPAADPVDTYVREQLKVRNIPGLSLAVVKDGRIVKAAGYGRASLELDAPATADTVYELGSIGKQFAADAILLLVEDGKLTLDDRVSRYISGTPDAWSDITIRHVLSHTAGLADFDSGNIGFSYRREYSDAEFVELLAKQPLQFAPGERWNYTNAFPLLGMIVENVTGVSYMDFVRDRIFNRLGLQSARFKVNGEVVRNRADGYLPGPEGFRHGERLRPTVIAANGGVMMNVEDFARWDIAITQGRLLQPSSLQAMTTPVRLKNGRTVSHGLGWFMDQFNGHRFGAHWGTTVTGHSAVIRRYVNDGVTVIVLANVDEGGGRAVDDISKRIADIYVPGTAVQGLKPIKDQRPGETARLRQILESVARGVETPGAPGLASRLPLAVRKRLALALVGSALELLGEERVGPAHFTLDPALATNRWYRATTPSGFRYLTLRLSDSGTLLGVVVED